MANQAALEHFADAKGTISAGFLGDGVFYVQIRGAISEAVGRRYAHYLGVALDSANSVRFFKDCSQLVSCDLLARSAVVRTMLAHRRRLTSMLVLTGPTGITLSNHHLDSILESSVEYTTDASAFEARVAQLAPLPRQKPKHESR